MLQTMLKSMRDATPQDGPLDSEQTRFYTSIMDQQLAQNLSTTGKLGFAKLIEQQLGRGVVAGAELDPAASLEALQRSLVAQQTANSAATLTQTTTAAAGGAERIRSLSARSDGLAVSGSASEFVNRIWPHAVEAASALGVPPQFLVAHSALESAWGKSEMRAADGSATYNLFGVKAGRNWQGPSVELQTTEYIDGVAQTVREKFRVYGSYAEAFRDYANLLRTSPRFAPVLGQQDGTKFAGSLQQSGYATDPLYADKLSRIINGPTLRQALSG
jgi:flagellar protein FlgJ